MTYLLAIFVLVMRYYYFAGRFETRDLFTYKEFTESLE